MTAASLGERALGDRVQERFASREVHVDGRAHDARAAGDLGHARVLVVAESVDRGVEDARDAAFGVRATPRPGSLPADVKGAWSPSG